MRKKKEKSLTSKKFFADFETTVDEDTSLQESSEVYLGGICLVGNKDKNKVNIFYSIEEFFDLLKKICEYDVNEIYFHNLAFDGMFILYYLLENNFQFDRKLETPNSFDCCITNLKQFYYITFKIGEKIVIFRDSYKILPMSLDRIGKDFKTEHQKLSISYIHSKDAEVTKEEIEYLQNDVLVGSEALDFVFNELGFVKNTIGGNCLNEFTKIINRNEHQAFRKLFPRCKDERYELTFANYNISDYDYCLKAYHGGWTYVRDDLANVICENGCVIDVNSLYPSVMFGSSDNYYPIGRGVLVQGQPTDDIIKNKFVFIRFKTRFYLKKGFLPFIQIKDDKRYSSNEMLKTSDIDGKKIDEDGNETIREFVMPYNEFLLFQEHYHLKDFQYIDYKFFAKEKGIFDIYIDKYRKMKIKATKDDNKALRTVAKLMLNNLYGKFATTDDSSYCVPYINKMGIISYNVIKENKKQTIYLPIGAAITSYAREFTIRAAQKNYDNFVYADTDSLHLRNIKSKDIKGVNLHPTDFLCWDVEKENIEVMKVLRSKCYIEKCNGEWDIKACGMCESAKKEIINKINNNEISIEKDFCLGKLKIEKGNLKKNNVRGGCLLREVDFSLN